MSIQVLDGVAAPEYVDQGIPYEAGIVAVDLTTAPAYEHMGLPFTPNGRLAVTEADPVYFGSGSAPFDATGRLCMSADVVDHYSAGIPYTSTGGIAAEGLLPFLGVRITVQPVSATVQEPSPAVYSVTAVSGDLSPLVYQWQQLILGVWTDLTDAPPVSGSQTSVLTIDPTTVSMTGTQFRVIVDNAVDSKTSNVVGLTVTAVSLFGILAENGDNLITEDLAFNLVQEAA